MEKPEIKNRIKWPFVVAPVLLAVLIVVLLLRCGGLTEEPTLTVSDVRAEGIESVVSVDVLLNRFGSALYPAASFILEFDKARLELLAVNEGNVIIASENGEIVPEWSVNVDRANENGEIKVMYLDVTGGTKAFSDRIDMENGILFRLQFRVRGSAREGDVYALNVADAVFAANDEADSLAMTTGTLRVKNGSIIVEAR